MKHKGLRPADYPLGTRPEHTHPLHPIHPIHTPNRNTLKASYPPVPDTTIEQTELPDGAPDIGVSLRQAFGLDDDGTVDGFSERTPLVPEVDENYRFNPSVTRAILAGFSRNRRVMVQGHHGTGKSTHIEQIAARLNWPCLRINFDGHISRVDLIGRDAIVLREGKQVTEFREGFLPWALQRPVALVFDEYDAGRADVMFVVQRVLEQEGKLTLLDQNRVLHPDANFRLFATANTVGLGDTSGLYHGTQQINQGQMDRWNITVTLNYLDNEEEERIICARVPELDNEAGRKMVTDMVAVATLTREALMRGDLSTVMSPRTVITWAENLSLFNDDPAEAFRLSFLNRCDEAEQRMVAELYQRRFGKNPLLQAAVKDAPQTAGDSKTDN